MDTKRFPLSFVWNSLVPAPWYLAPDDCKMYLACGQLGKILRLSRYGLGPRTPKGGYIRPMEFGGVERKQTYHPQDHTPTEAVVVCNIYLRSVESSATTNSLIGCVLRSLLFPCPGIIVGIQYLILFGFVEDSPDLHLAVEILTLAYGLVVLTFG